jgi:hypothetical protein
VSHQNQIIVKITLWGALSVVPDTLRLLETTASECDIKTTIASKCDKKYKKV